MRSFRRQASLAGLTQIFGRQGRWAFRVILEHGTRPGRNRRLQLTPALKDALSWVLDNVPKAEPRAFRTPAASSYQVFTDGSFERGTGRLGGVLRSPTGQITDWFQATVPSDVVQSWLQSDILHPILQCELLAVSVAAALWGSLLKEVLAVQKDYGLTERLMRKTLHLPSSEPLKTADTAEKSVGALLGKAQV